MCVGLCTDHEDEEIVRKEMQLFCCFGSKALLNQCPLSSGPGTSITLQILSTATQFYMHQASSAGTLRDRLNLPSVAATVDTS